MAKRQLFSFKLLFCCRERAWLKPENQNITNTTICTKCGGRGHLAQDCVAQQPSMSLQPGVDGAPPVGPGGVDRAKMDSEVS